MWIFCNDSFLSIVAHREDPDVFLVRARRRGDIEAAFPCYVVTETPNADYRFRAAIPRGVVVDMLAERLESIEYDNFKGSIPFKDGPRHDAYMGVWSVMNRYQQGEYDGRTRGLDADLAWVDDDQGLLPLG